MTPRPFALLWTLALFLFVTARIFNRTIDDTGGETEPKASQSLHSISYEGGWGDQCGSVCNIVNSSLAYNRTLHDSTSTSPDDVKSMIIRFSGTAIYLFGIEANLVDGVTTRSNLTFQIDGELVGTRLHLPNLTTRKVSYNVPIYTNSSLVYGDHSVNITQAAISTDEKDHTLLLFDYAIYTFDDEPRLPSSSTPVSPATQTTTISTNAVKTSASSGTALPPNNHKLPVGAIVGIVFGSQVLLVASLILCWRRRRGDQRRSLQTLSSADHLSDDSHTPPDGPERPQSLGPVPPYPSVPPQRPPPAYDTIFQRLLGRRAPSVSTGRNQQRQQQMDAPAPSLSAPTQVKGEK